MVCIDDAKKYVERASFKHAHQLRETLLITAETETPSAWQTFANYAKARQQNTSNHGDATDEAVDKLFNDEIVHSQAATMDRKGISVGTCLKAHDTACTFLGRRTPHKDERRRQS